MSTRQGMGLAGCSVADAPPPFVSGSALQALHALSATGPSSEKQSAPSFMLFIAACSCINAICTEVSNDKCKSRLPKRGSPFNNLSRLCWTASGFGLGRALEAAIDY